MTVYLLLRRTAAAIGRWPVCRALAIASVTGIAPVVLVLAATRWAVAHSVTAALALGAAFATTGVGDALVRSVGAWTGTVLNTRLRATLVATGTGPLADRAIDSPAWEESRGTGIRREPKPGEAFAEALSWLSTVVGQTGLIVVLGWVHPLIAVGTMLIGVSWRGRRVLRGMVLAGLGATAVIAGAVGLGWYAGLLAAQATIGLAWLELTRRPIRRRVIQSGLRLLAAYRLAVPATVAAPSSSVGVEPSCAVPLVLDGVTGIVTGSRASAAVTARRMVEAALRAGVPEVAVLASPPLCLPFDVCRNVWPTRSTPDEHNAAFRFAPLAELVAGLPLGWRTPCSDEWDGGVELDAEQWAVVGASRLLARLDDGAPLAVADVSSLPASAVEDFVAALRSSGRPAVSVGVRIQDARLFDRILTEDTRPVQPGVAR